MNTSHKIKSKAEKWVRLGYILARAFGLAICILPLLGCTTVYYRYYKELRQQCPYGILAARFCHPGSVSVSSQGKVSLRDWAAVSIQLSPPVEGYRHSSRWVPWTENEANTLCFFNCPDRSPAWVPLSRSASGYGEQYYLDEFFLLPLPCGEYTLESATFQFNGSNSFVLLWVFPIQRTFQIDPNTVNYIGSLYFRESHDWVGNQCPFEVVIKDESERFCRILDDRMEWCQCTAPRKPNGKWKYSCLADWVLYDLRELRKLAKFAGVKTDLIVKGGSLLGVLTVHEYQLYPSYSPNTTYYRYDYNPPKWNFRPPPMIRTPYN